MGPELVSSKRSGPLGGDALALGFAAWTKTFFFFFMIKNY